MLGNLPTQDNALSVWHLEADRSNFQQIVAAFVSTWKKLDEFEFALLPVDRVVTLGIRIEQTPGETLDVEANRQWHRDLVELSATKLVELARVVMESYKDRILPKRVAQLVAQEIRSGRIPKNQVKPSFLKDISQWYEVE